MNFVSPERWIWLAAAIPIIVFYILRSRLKKQAVSTLLFWDELFDQKRQRSWWQRLRHLLSLLLQLAFLALIVLALLDPLWTGQKQATRQIVLVVDNSASMSAIEPDDTDRFTAAIRAAEGVVRELRDGDEIALVTAGGAVRVVVGMTDFGPAVRDALLMVSPTDGPTRVVEAVEAARRMTRSPERREIVVISDGAFSGNQTIAAADDVRLVLVGSPRDNVAITRLAVRRSLVDPIGYAAMVEVSSFAETPTRCRLSLELDEELVDVIPIELAPGEVWKRTIVGASAAGGILSATIELNGTDDAKTKDALAVDALAVDNVARAILPQRAKIPVTLVTSQPSLYLESVLGAIPLVELTITDEASADSPTDGFTVLHRSESATIPGGAVLIIDPRADTDAFTLGEPIDQPIVVSQDSTSPLMPHVRLQNVILAGARGVTMTDAATPLLVDAGGETLMASRVAGEDRMVVLTANLDDGDLPLRIAFPVLMTNAVNWFLSRSGEIEPSLQTGRLAKIELPTRTRTQQAVTTENAVPENAVPENAVPENAWTWTDPDGVVHVTTTEGETALVGPVARAGLVTLQRSGETIKKAAVNLCDASESDLRPRGELESAAPRRQQAGYRSIWFYLTCVALGLIVGEWFLYQRRIVG
ncbi:vWA domain-containing protein [Neorhodopirellula pilleata]|uniref:VWFA domain-containing protein n=1 Tax=Neorhodopirellula pilleata TaxID=2714738 RepID=A0A5C6AIX0_9BACT|nr:VWA domain-containing protein [Neorhodopirellula pilleata]TWT99011.1 hypothetical protein Pla100_21790 [Neorhodopirellula pilleata]